MKTLLGCGFAVAAPVRKALCLGTAALFLHACGGGGDSSPVDKYASVPTPTATSIPSDPIGSANHNYPFFSPDFDLAQFGFVQEEFFIDGKANSYDLTYAGGVGTSPATGTPNVVTSNNPYRTRLHVIRPSDPAKFNGTVIYEWLNTTGNYDLPVHWLQQKDMILRKGYAWVGVSAQNQGISGAASGVNNGLKAWSPTRYATLDVTNVGKITAEGLSLDIFAQGAKSVRAVPAVMGGLAVKKVIAIGASQSAGRMGQYLNSLEPQYKIFDGALLSVGGPVMRSDLALPVIKVLSDSEVSQAAAQLLNEITVLQPNTAKFATWNVPGATHVENYGLAVRSAILVRDLNVTQGDNCPTPTRGRAPIRYVFNSAIDKLEKFIDNGTSLPAPQTPVQVVRVDPPLVARDQYGNTLGGVRLPEVEVPIATDNGLPQTANFGCFLSGQHIPFDKGTLDALYPTHDSYVQKYTSAANAAVTAGFMLRDDADVAIADAQSSIVGDRLNCGSLCADVGQFQKAPSSGTMRLFTFSYNVPDRAKLLAHIDDATRFIAIGNLIADPTAARPTFSLAIDSLKLYIADVQAQLQKGTISKDAATFLTSQANTLTTELAKL